MNEKRIRIKVGSKLNFGTEDFCKRQLDNLSKMFQEDKLSRYGLERNAETFDDLMSGGAEAIRQYRERLEMELPVNSVLPYISEKAKRDVEEAVDELRYYIDSVNKAKSFNNPHAMHLQNDYVRFDEESNCVVLTDLGREALENEVGYYITNRVQLDIFNLANEVKKKYEELDKLVRGHSAVLNVRDVLKMDSKDTFNVVVKNIVNI